MLGRVVWWDGPAYAWCGVVVREHHAHAIIMDIHGRLCRVPIVVWLSFVQDRRRARAVLREVEPLVRYGAVQEALHLAASTPLDPSGYDIWTLPLHDIGQTAKLQPIAARYYGSPAHVRRQFDTACLMLQHRQWEVFRRTVLGQEDDQTLAREANTSRANIRMARMRALKRAKSIVGDIVHV